MSELLSNLESKVASWFDANEDVLQMIASGSEFFFELVLGAMVIGSSLLVFGYGVYKGWIDDLTPRIANRPKNVLKNAMLHHLPKWMSTPILYPITWIGWAYCLTYDECIKGIPGTGTRKEGTEGPLLKNNIDTVIMLRFHTFFFKVGMLVFVLCAFVLFPVNWTAKCDPVRFGEGTCYRIRANQTLFERSSIWNVPDRIFSDSIETVVNTTFDINDLFLGFNKVNTTDSVDDRILVASVDQRLRVLATVISCVLIYLYTFYLLHWQWIENVALRRKYFLEATHYSKRTKELNQLALRKDEIDNVLLDDKNLSESTLQSNKVLAARLRQEQMNEDKNRPEHLTHPEITENPPSIGLYSVLFQLPRAMVTYDTDGATTLERQLVATANFFDEIVPPESGFSSSVAAITVLPNAKLVSRARKKWEICEKTAQKLRYARKVLRRRIKRQEEYERKYRERQRNLFNSTLEAARVKRDETPEVSEEQIQTSAKRINADGSIESLSSCEKSLGTKPPLQEDETKTPEEIRFTEKKTPPSPPRSSATTKSNQTLQSNCKISTEDNAEDTFRNITSFRYEFFNISEYASSMGFHEEVHDMRDFVNGMGIEEFNVFAYDCAILAGNNPGFDERLFNQCGIETLRDLEKDLTEQLRVANEELLEARRNLVMVYDENELNDPPEQPSMPCDDEDSVIEQYGACEVTGNSSMGIRKRKISGIASGNSGASAIFPHDHGASDGKYTGDDVNMKPKPSFIQRLWKPVKCILLIPRRIYCGIEGSNEWREPLKYYGTEDLSDTETGRTGFITNLDHPSYVVVTFTTRHAAVIARQCLADGAPQNHWKNVDDLPFYPLADAPPWEIMRPVTPTIPYASKKLRRWIIYTIITAFTIANVYILEQINNIFLDPKIYSRVFNVPLETASSWSNTLSGLSQTLLLSIAPYIFEILANIEGSATSEGKVEQTALIFFWYFFIVARYMGQIVWGMVEQVWEGSSIEASVNQGIADLTRTIPTTLGPSTLNYIIFAATITWPAIYFLQLPNLATRFLRLKWFNRILKRGGPGAEVPYRIYVDSGYIFAGMTTLAPLCPMIGLVCLLYFIIVVPMLRWLLVFGYRPRFDGGGDKWPKLHHIIVSSLLLGQVVTSITLILKQNRIEGVFILLWIIPTLLYSSVLLEKFLPSYRDAALLQTRRMYSHAENASANSKCSLQREEYRRWLVDCHKASYLPSCLSGGAENLLTSEPAVVTWDGMSTETDDEDIHEKESERNLRRNLLQRQKSQKGGILRRQRFNI